MTYDECVRVIEKAEKEGATELDLSGKGLEKLPPGIGRLTHLTSLSLGGNRLRELPESLTRLTQLTSLDFSANQLSGLPESVTRLTQLTSLRLDVNQLSELPQSLARLTQLTSLNLGDNQFSELPQSLARLTQLTSLNLGDNQFSELPQSLARLTQLTSLNLGDNQFSELPQSLTRLTQLTALKLYSNQLSELPESLARLTQLTALYLANNQLSELPESLTRLTQLTSLDFSANQLSELPQSLARLTQLTSLNLGDNQFSELPQSLTRLTQLTALKLYSNQLSELPESLARLTQLTALYLANNQLSELPESLTRLTQLTSLDFSANQLSELPESLTRLTQLTSLDLANNQLSELPESLTRLTQLTSLRLDVNQLSELPESLTRLTQLTTLRLDVNQLSELPESLARLTQLTLLNLANNQLSELPESLTRLTQLTLLSLDNNQLSELPESLTRLSRLEVLYLEGNELEEVPHFLTNLKNLEQLDLRKNVRLPIPPEIVDKWQDAPAILRYIEQLAGKEAKRPLNEAKMLLVGEGQVGKTSLVDMLLTGRADQKRKQTDGVEIRRWDVRPISGEGAPADNGTVQLNIWDFGGQEIMHATHQFFLTKRSLYLVVLNAREGETRGRLDYWLKIIDSFGGDSPVIVVVNRGDEHRLELNRADLQRKYPDRIRGFIETACFGDIKGEPGRNGIAELKTLIAREVGRLHHIRDPLLARWFEVKRQLEEMKVNYIPESDYVAMCAGQGIDHEGDQDLLLGYLNDLGVVLTFRDDRRLRDTNILNPVWVTDGIYRILNSPLVFQSKGVLRREVLGEILDPAEYPSDRYEFLIGMMRRFELCFAFEGREGEYLIPDLLSKEAPFLNWDEETALNWEFHYDVLPSSVISRFMVRTSLYLPTEGTATWRTGVVIEVEGCKARVRADPDAAKISVSIVGQEPARHRALAVIRSQFDHIHDTISGIKAEEKVPVPGQDAKPVSYQYLLELRKKGVREFLPEGGEELVDVAWLLEGIEELAGADGRGFEKEGFGRRGRPAREWEDEAEGEPEIKAPAPHGQSAGAGGAAVAPALEPKDNQAPTRTPSAWDSIAPILTVVVIFGILTLVAVSLWNVGLPPEAFNSVLVGTILLAIIVFAVQLLKGGLIGENSLVDLFKKALDVLRFWRRAGDGEG